MKKPEAVEQLEDRLCTYCSNSKEDQVKYCYGRLYSSIGEDSRCKEAYKHYLEEFNYRKKDENNKLSFKLPNGDIKEIPIKINNRSYSVNAKEDKRSEEIAKIKEDNMYKEYGIIHNQIYDIKLIYGDSIKGVIMNFDSNTFCIKGIVGMYIVKRTDIDSMYPSDTSRNIWEESRKEYLESFIETI